VFFLPLVEINFDQVSVSDTLQSTLTLGREIAEYCMDFSPQNQILSKLLCVNYIQVPEEFRVDHCI